MKLRFAILFAVVGLLSLAAAANAQRGGKPAPAAGRMSLGMRGSGFRPARPLRFRLLRREVRYGSGWGWAYLPFPEQYADYGSEYYEDNEDGYARTMMQGDTSGSSTRPVMGALLEHDVQPVLIERQGDRWVPVTGYSESAATVQTGTAAHEMSHSSPVSPFATLASENHGQIPAAVLVFRDGHHEEVKSYTIIGDAIYAKADYWVDGLWTRKIEIANLDVPATLKLNQERGSQFRLPSQPQEVMIRP